MADQADTAVDPFEQAVSLIANSPESDDLEEDEDQDEPLPDDEGEETSDAEDEESGATETPKREVLFAGQKFEIPEGTPDEVAAKVEDIGKNLQADYTRKTQELVSREKQAAEVVQRELNQGRQQIQQEIRKAGAIIQAVGGLMDPAAMAELANTDPQAWIQANARQQQVQAYLNQLGQAWQEQEQQAKQDEANRIEAAKQQAWQRLSDEGITHEGLQKLWNDAKSSYSFINDERLSQVLDAESWLVLRDAIAFRQLKAQRPNVTKKAAEAPKVPQGKQPMPQDVRKKLDARKAVQRKGGAGLRDLAAFLETNSR